MHEYLTQMKVDLGYSWLVRLTFDLSTLCTGKGCVEDVEARLKFSLDFLCAALYGEKKMPCRPCTPSMLHVAA